MRKATICGYADLIKSSDIIRNHRTYIKAANLAAKIYLELDDRKNNPIDANHKEEQSKKQESAEERKQRRKENKAKAAQKATENKKDEAKDAMKYKIDETAGEDYLKADFIENAQTFLAPLLDLDVMDLEFYQRAFEVYSRKNKVCQ